MATPLKEQYEACREALLTAIIDALQERADYIASIERTANGDVPVTGIALELFPWHSILELSLRLSSDFPLGKSRYDSADWPHFEFTKSCQSPSIETAISLVTEVYDQGEQPNNDLCEMAHLTFMAGAEALLHPNVAHLLNEFGIDAPVLIDQFVSSPFQYIVTDGDETVEANYCDIVLAARVTQRLLK